MHSGLAIITCDSCGSSISRMAPSPEAVAREVEALQRTAHQFGWVRSELIPCQGPRDYCGDCVRNLAPEVLATTAVKNPRPSQTLVYRAPRRGLTLVELIVVLAIVGILAAVALPVVRTSLSERGVVNAAQVVQGAFDVARSRAGLDGKAGVRLVPSPVFLARRADGSIDPAAELAWDRLVPLEQPPGYRAGLVAVRPASTWPSTFTPPSRVLVLEQERLDADGRLVEPTAWAWNVRLGDRLELMGKKYTVCGPMVVGPDGGNVESFVNYGPDGPKALDRRDGVQPPEWLYLVNGIDDDGDGRIDNGWNGVDDDLDGVVDNWEEWAEDERWSESVRAALQGGGELRRRPYTLYRRPAPASGAAEVQLSGAVIDGTGALAADAINRVRSRLPVDPWTGQVDLIFDATGRVSPSRIVGVPTADGLADRWYHLWIGNREDVSAPPRPSGDARLLTIDRNTGRTSTVETDAADPTAARRAAEGGGL